MDKIVKALFTIVSQPNNFGLAFLQLNKGERMTRKPCKHLRTRRKLEWFFEQLSIGDLQSLPLRDDLIGGAGYDRSRNKTGRRLEVGRIKSVLERLGTAEGIPYNGGVLRLSGRMLEHVFVEFSDKAKAIELLYGTTGENEKAGKNKKNYWRTLDIALTRIEAAFYFLNIL